MSLLIVEDNSPMREMLKSIFKFQFTQISECEDGDTALSSYEQSKPDWVFMDVEMKRVDGITASKQILKAYPDARIIILTNYDNAEIKKEAMSAGVYEYVIKENVLDILEILENNSTRV
ncbi:MAG: response regulator [Bacteroidota bacterium]|nr:response regulator [Bacteroidota bacterium]